MFDNLFLTKDMSKEKFDSLNRFCRYFQNTMKRDSIKISIIFNAFMELEKDITEGNKISPHREIAFNKECYVHVPAYCFDVLEDVLGLQRLGLFNEERGFIFNPNKLTREKREMILIFINQILKSISFLFADGRIHYRIEPVWGENVQ